MEWARRSEAWNRSGTRSRFVLKESDLALTCGAGNGAVRSSRTPPKGPGTIPGLEHSRRELRRGLS